MVQLLCPMDYLKLDSVSGNIKPCLSYILKIKPHHCCIQKEKNQSALPVFVSAAQNNRILGDYLLNSSSVTQQTIEGLTGDQHSHCRMEEKPKAVMASIGLKSNVDLPNAEDLGQLTISKAFSCNSVIPILDRILLRIVIHGYSSHDYRSDHHC